MSPKDVDKGAVADVSREYHTTPEDYAEILKRCGTHEEAVPELTADFVKKSEVLPRPAAPAEYHGLQHPGKSLSVDLRFRDIVQLLGHDVEEHFAWLRTDETGGPLYPPSLNSSQRNALYLPGRLKILG